MASTQDNGGVQNPNGVSTPQEGNNNPNPYPLSSAGNVRLTQNVNNFVLGESSYHAAPWEQLLGAQGNRAAQNPSIDQLRGLYETGGLTVGSFGSVQNPNPLSLGQPYVPLQQRPLATQGDRESLIRRPKASFLDHINRYQASIDDLYRAFKGLDLSSSRTNPSLPNDFGNRYALTSQRVKGDNLSPGLERLAQQGTYMLNGPESDGESSYSPYQRSRNFFGTSDYSTSYSSSPDQYPVVDTNAFRRSERSMYQPINFPSRNRLNSFRNRRLGPQLPSNLRLNDLRGMIASCARNEVYCTFWRDAMDNASREEIDMVFAEIAAEDICEISCNASGGVLVQKLIQKCIDGQRIQILLMMTGNLGNFHKICCDLNGSHAAMKLWIWLSSEEQKQIFFSALSFIFTEMTTNAQGHTFVKWSLKNFPNAYSQPLLLILANASVDVASDKHGCRVLNELISQLPEQATNLLARDIIANAVPLSENSYGNYVVQQLMDTKGGRFMGNILQVLKGNYVKLSFNKYASHVVQKCLDISLGEESYQIIEELRRNPFVTDLLTDPYGNYVIQSAIVKAKNQQSHQFMALAEIIRKNKWRMYYNKYGMKVIECLEQMVTRNLIGQVSV